MEIYDFVIVGSGLGGLECGFILAKEGYNVCILEKNRQLGGTLQTFVRDKVIFDTGVHYIGGLDEGQNLNRYFKYFGLMDKLKLRRMDEEGFDIVSFDDDPIAYPHAMGYKRFQERLIEFFPKEKAAIATYCKMINEIKDFFPLYNVIPEKVDAFETRFLEMDTAAYLQTITTNKKLQDVLAGTNPLYAGEENKTPLYVHALVVNTYIESAYKCVDGGSQISKYLARSIREMGGTINNYKHVTKLEFEGSKIAYAETNEGERFYGKTFISNVHPSVTLDLMDADRVKKSYAKRINSLENSISAFTLHLTFKEKTFPYLNHNRYHYKTKNVWDILKHTDANWPLGMAIFCPATSRNEDWAEGLNVMSYMRFDEVEKWAGSHNTIPRNVSHRGDDYLEFTEKKSEILMREVEKLWPGIRAKVKSQHCSTPLSFRDYIGTHDGAMYGIQKDYRSPLKSFISPKTKVENLFLTGQNLNLHGMLGVTIGSVVTCSTFLGLEYLINKINNAG